MPLPVSWGFTIHVLSTGDPCLGKCFLFKTTITPFLDEYLSHKN